jgi:hypothetical protein
MPLQEDTDELLDQCVLLNTYFSNYFKPIGCVESFDIYFRLDDFDNNFSMALPNSKAFEFDTSIPVSLFSDTQLTPLPSIVNVIAGN